MRESINELNSELSTEKDKAVDNNTQNVFIRLTDVEKEGIIEFENTKCINSNMKDFAYTSQIFQKFCLILRF